MKKSFILGTVLTGLLSGCSLFYSHPPGAIPGAEGSPYGSAHEQSYAHLKRLPTHPLNVKTQCTFKDEVGMQVRLDLDIQDSKVLKMNATISLSEQGTCKFDLASLRQTKAMPSIELKNAQNGCIIRVWQQDNNVTFATTHCADSCSPRAAYNYLWPIVIDTKTHECS